MIHHSAEDTGGSVSDVTEGLMNEFHDRLTVQAISGTVADARRQLKGQTVDEAMPELLHQLAHTRLDQLAVADDATGF